MKIESNDVYIIAYQKICEIMLENTNLQKLISEDNAITDFDFIENEEQEEFVNIPYQPKNRGRIYLLPTSVEYPRETSCNNNLIIHYQMVMEGFKARDPYFHQICYRVLAILRDIPFYSIILDDECFPVICQVGNGNWEYDAEHQTMTHTIDFTVEIRI